MKRAIQKKTFILVALLGMGFTITLSPFANEAFAQSKHRGYHGPPPEAYDACEGLSAGDTVELETTNGDILTGTCEAKGDRLVLRPDNPPDDRFDPSEEM
jgi:hypothetical protein